jgi:molecular chaperone DnaK
MLIGTLTVHGSKIRRDIPSGSEVEISVEIDATGRVTAKAFIPWIDEEFEAVFGFIRNKPTLSALREGVEAGKKRLEQVRQRATGLDDAAAQQALQRIDGERMVHDIDTALDTAARDPDAADKCQKRILDLRRAIDQVEDTLDWPVLVREAGWEMRDGGEIIHRLGSPSHVLSFEALVRRMNESIESRSFDELRRQIAALKLLLREMLLERARNQEAEAAERRSRSPH